MLRKLLLALSAFSFISVSSNAQSTITLWTFDALADANSSTGTLTPLVGTGTAAVIGGATGAAYNSGYPTNANDNSGWQTTDYPAQGTGSKTAGTEYAVSTVGYRDITFSFVLRYSNTAANTIMVQYSTDGTNFTDYQYFAFTPAATGTGDTWYSRSVDFSNVYGLDNNPNAKFRVVTAFDTVAGTYLAARSTSTYAGGTMRYDSVLVSAQAPFSASPSINLFLSANAAIETQGTVITLTATAENAVTGNQTVDVTVSGLNITGSDYSLGNTTITIPAGAVSGTTTFTVLNDGVAEGNETVVVALTNPSAGVALGSAITGNILISDNNFPTLAILTDTVTGYEIDETQMVIKLVADSLVTGDQEIYLQVAGTDVTATDYTLSVDTVIIPDGDSIGYATFTVLHDAYFEGNATEIALVKVIAAGPSTNIGIDSVLSITIHNDLSNLPAEVLADSNRTNALINIDYMQSPLVLSGSMGDTTDPVRTHGVVFVINDPDNTGTKTVSVASSNITVVPLSGLQLTNVQDTFTLKITPAAVGFSTITFTVSDSLLLTQYSINYAASGLATDTVNSRYHTLSNEASTVIALDNTYMLVANDEDNVLRVYHRNLSGAPVKEFNMNDSLGLTDKADIEGSARVGNRIYWVSSHSNSGSGAIQTNRRRLFATDVTGTGVNTVLTYAGRYDSLRDDLVNWDVNNGHGLGANYYGFFAATQAGVGAEDINSNGFNIEGLALMPDSIGAYLCFRAPIVPPTQRQFALIVPVLNFTSLAISNGNAGTAQFGAPIELDLDGRAIRSLERNANNQYLIVAGPASTGSTTLPTDFKLYGWMGNPTDTAFELPLDLTIANNTSGSYESIVSVPENLVGNVTIQLLLDNGDTEWYGAPSTERKHMKFRSDWFTFSTLGTPLQLENIVFTASKCYEEVCINWWNSNEKQIGHYEVERSEDGRNFKKIAQVSALNQAGTQAYSAKDELKELKASRIFYRLKQTKLNGTIGYSNVQRIDLGDINAEIEVSLAPNPASDKVTISSTGNWEKIEVLDMTGKLYETILSPGTTEILNTQKYPVGIYNVKCTSGATIKVLKLSINN